MEDGGIGAPIGAEADPLTTLPDYLDAGLDLVLVGINPSVYSAQRGHYFARRTSRFWPAFSSSRLSARARAGLGRETLGPEDDASLLRFGIGLTDVVKRPTRNAAQLAPADFEAEAPRLLARLEDCRPRVACFQGVTAYRAFVRYALGEREPGSALGPRPRRIGETELFVVPSPSPANAHFRPSDQVAWYDRLADWLSQPTTDGGR